MQAILRLSRVILAVATCLLPAMVRAEDAVKRPNLTGQVLSEADQPVKDARVFIYTAQPKSGPGILCPSCYADCVKKSATDAEGKFTIKELDPNLLFRVLVVAKGYKPEFIEKVDPAEEPIEAILTERSLPEDSKQQVLGKVIDSKGEPIEGAVVSIRGVSRGERTQYGGNRGTDPIAVSDEDGNFVIASTTPFDAVGVDVEARGFAKGIFQRLATGGERHELKLDEGVMLRGRVLDGDKPLAGVEIGISGVERRSEIYIGNWSVATDAEGKFVFGNVPAKTAYQLYGKMASLHEYGSIPSRIVRTAEDGPTLDVGDIKLERGYRLEGRVVLADRNEVPEGTKVLLGRDNAWDSRQITIGEEGQFAFSGVPPEVVTLTARVPGYRISARNASLEPLNPYHLEGVLLGDKTNLILELELGRNHERLEGDQLANRGEPLRGIETADEYPDGIKIAGTIVDEKANPIERFTVKEGRDGMHGQGMIWHSTRMREFTEGRFSLSFAKHPQSPGVLIEAEGFNPQTIGPVTESTNAIVRMTKGGGVAATLLTAEGKPAPNVQVYLIDTGRNGVYVNEKLEVQDRIYQGTKKATTDENGRFLFPPQIDAFAIIVIDDLGFAKVPVGDFEKTKEIHLQPWAKVRGKLLIGSKPGANESIRLWPAHIPYEDHPRQFQALSFYLNTKTDESGEFEFPRVPPVAVEIYHEPKVRDSRMGTIPVSQNSKFVLNPGETRELTIGGKGRAVIGKLVVHGYDEKIDWRADVQTIELEVPEPEELPNFRTLSSQFAEAMRNAKTDDEKKTLQEQRKKDHEQLVEKSRAFYKTDAGRAYHFAKKRYALNFAQEGTFRIEDVPPGNYSMNIDLREKGTDDFNRFSAPRIATFKKEFEMPPIAGDRSDEPLDLGTIELQSAGSLKPGKTAPEFSVKTIEDKVVKLSDFKGKFLLLDFWAVWCGPCVAEMPHLKETFAAFKDNPRFAMLALSLDPDVKAPRDYVSKNNLGWVQGFLGDWSKTDLPTRYGVEGIPATFLIGPDGKIISSNLRGTGIKSAVEAALASKPTDTARK